MHESEAVRTFLGNPVYRQARVRPGRLCVLTMDHPPPPPPDARPPASAGAALSRAEFAALFREHARSLWLLSAGLVHVRSDADDVLQEATLQAVKRLSEFQRGSNFRAWIAQFVRFVAANQNRSRQRERARIDAGASSTLAPGPAEPADDRIADAAPSPIDRHGELADSQEAFDDHVVSGLRTLDPVARACLLLRTVGGLSFREVSALLDIPEGTAMSHVFRARTALLRTIQPESRSHTTLTKEPHRQAHRPPTDHA